MRGFAPKLKKSYTLLIPLQKYRIARNNPNTPPLQPLFGFAKSLPISRILSFPPPKQDQTPTVRGPKTAPTTRRPENA